MHDLKSYWIKRDPWVPFYTLGAASYLDAVGNSRPTYYSKAKHDNPILWEHFKWLYERLSDKLARTLGEPIAYPPMLALPGFHIYLWCLVFERPVFSIHRDLQYTLLDWKSSTGIDFTRPISFTLAIKLPKSGGGLYIWNLDHEEIRGLPRPEIDRLIGSRKKTFHPYKAGKLILHSGHQVHQVAPMQNAQPDDERITLQGHGLLCQGTWQLYW